MEHWTYAPADDLADAPLERLRRFPREPDMLQYALRSSAAMAVRTYLRLYHRFRIEGAEHLTGQGSFVMISNHCSHMDALCLLSALPLGRLHRAFPAAAADYFFVSLPRLVAAVLVVNALPFERSGYFRDNFEMCRALLKQPGNVLVLFPEGKRSVTGEPGPFKPGVAMLVAGTSIPVLPCYLSGTFAALPKQGWFPRPRLIRLTIGRPRTYEGSNHDHASLMRIGEDLRAAVLALNAGEKPPRDVSPCTMSPQP